MQKVLVAIPIIILIVSNFFDLSLCTFCCSCVIFGLVVYLLAAHRRKLVIVFSTLPRDIPYVLRAVYALWRIKKCELHHQNFIDLFEENVKRNGRKVCFYFEDQKWTFKNVQELSNKIANIFAAKNYKKGDVVALQMGNCPMYIAIWLGLGKLGVITALINTKLRGSGLAHCVYASKAKSIICTQEFSSGFDDIDLNNIDLFVIDSDLWQTDIQNSASEFSRSVNPINFRDPILYIYTSGTTGLPKAAIITHSKCILICEITYFILKCKPSDVFYNPLPLYHTSGGILAVAPSLVHGSAVVLRRNFSASNYFSDCAKYNVTVGMYIGEMCRYILATVKKESIVSHTVRMMIGNGLKPQIWKDFMETCKIPQIYEFYGSTEGNANMVNCDGRVGAVGFLPQFVPRRVLPLDLIRVNESGEPVRGSNGLCIRCSTDEPGMLVGAIYRNITQSFNGYVGGDKENRSKIFHNVFRSGDKVFVTGDVLVADKYGYLYFKDRLGDTFRWKGENVSTDEVEEVATRALGNLSVPVCAYGVSLENYEGRAGMLAICDPDNTVQIQSLVKEFDQHLPPYARPLFLRIIRDMPMTGTFKIKKGDLQKEGIDPEKVHDNIYFRSGPSYVLLTKELYELINTGQVKL